MGRWPLICCVGWAGLGHVGLGLVWRAWQDSVEHPGELLLSHSSAVLAEDPSELRASKRSKRPAGGAEQRGQGREISRH